MPQPTTQNLRPSQRSRVVARRTPNTAQFQTDEIGRGLGEISEAFARFAGNARDEDRREEVLRDEEALGKLAMDIHGREAEAVQAVRSGDFSKFMDAERASRSNILKNAPLVIGETLGSTSATEFVSKVLPDLEQNESGTAAAREYFDAQVEGMNPRAALKFKESFDKGISKALKSRREAQEELAAQQMEARTSVFLREGIETNTLGTHEDINAHIRKAAASNPTASMVENLLKLRAEADEAIVVMSASPDMAVASRAAKLLYSVDPERGYSIAQKMEADSPGSLRKLQEEATKAFYGARTPAVDDLIEESLNRATEVEKGLQPELTLGVVARDLRTKAEAMGWSGPLLEQTYRKVISKLDDDTVALSNRTLSVRSPMSNAELDAQIAKFGLTDTQTLQRIKYNGATPKLKTALSQGLLTSDMDEFKATRAALNTLMDISGNGASAYLEDDKALVVFLWTENSAGDDALQMREALRERLQEHDGEIEGAFSSRFSLKDLTGASNTGDQRSRYAAMAEILFDDDALVQEFGLEGLEWDTMSDNLKTKFRKVLDVATIAASDDGSLESIKKNFLRAFKDDFEIGGVALGGVKKFTPRHTPRVSQGAGTVVRGRPLDDEMAERFLNEAADADVRAGFRSDAETRVDGTVLVTVAEGAGMQGVSLQPGDVLVPEGMLHANFLNNTFLGSEEVVGGKMLLSVPKPGLQEDGTEVPLVIQVNPVTQLRWNDSTRTWDMRRALGPDLGALRGADTPEKLKAAVEAMGITQADAGEAADILNELQASAIERLQGQDNEFAGMTADEMRKRLRGLSKEILKAEPEERRGIAEEQSRLVSALKVRVAAGGPPVSAAEVSSFLEADDPRTKSMEELKAILIAGVKEHGKNAKQIEPIRRALKERSEGVPPLTRGALLPEETVPGSSRAIDNVTPPQRDTINRARSQAIRQHILDGIADKTFSYESLAATRGARTIEEAEEMATTATRMAGATRDTLMPTQELVAGRTSGFMGEIVSFIQESEGFVKFPTKDPGADQLNIGYGTHLETAEALGALQAAGLTKAKVMSQGVNREQAEVIASYHVAKTDQWMRKHFQGVNMPRNVKKALHSFVYSSRWATIPAGYLSPTLVGPELTKAIRNRRWSEAATIMRQSPGVSSSSGIFPAMLSRRDREAAVLEGFNR